MSNLASGTPVYSTWVWSLLIIPACLTNTDADLNPRKSGASLVEPLDLSRLAVNLKTAMRTPLVKPCQKSQMLCSQKSSYLMAEV